MIFSLVLSKKENVYSEYLGEEIVDLLGKTFEIPNEYNYEVIKVDPGYECRLDLISKDIYNDEIYTDVLMKLNGPSNPFEINEDMYIIVPTLESVTDFTVKPNKIWNIDENSSSKFRPKPKAKNEKRKPNEAIIGDRRFNIDTNSKIVIY